MNGSSNKKKKVVGIVEEIEYKKGIEIIESENINKDNEEYGTKGGQSTRDRMFLLSIGEAVKYFLDDEDREATSTEYAKTINGMLFLNYGHSENSGWWLRMPGDHNGLAAFVDSNGQIIGKGNYVRSKSQGIRAAFKLQIPKPKL